MKFVLNHPYKFLSPGTAFFALGMHIAISVMIELVTILVLLSAFGALNVVLNFLALTIID